MQLVDQGDRGRSTLSYPYYTYHTIRDQDDKTRWTAMATSVANGLNSDGRRLTGLSADGQDSKEQGDIIPSRSTKGEARQAQA